LQKHQNEQDSNKGSAFRANLFVSAKVSVRIWQEVLSSLKLEAPLRSLFKKNRHLYEMTGRLIVLR